MYSKCDLTNKKPQVKEQVFNSARDHLIKTFGINLSESNTKKGTYYLTNALKENQQDEDQQHICWGDRDNAHMALTFVILGQIFMSNGKVTDDQLLKCLKKLGLYQEEDKPSKRGANRSQSSDVDPELLELFDGDIKKFINEVLVTKQQYLKRDKVETNDADVEVWEYTWGERAKLEVKESDVLKMVCELYECEPRMFKEQYDKVNPSAPLIVVVALTDLLFRWWRPREKKLWVNSGILEPFSFQLFQYILGKRPFCSYSVSVKIYHLNFCVKFSYINLLYLYR